MIISFRHKGLEEFFRTGSKRGIQAAHAKRLDVMLAFLNVADDPSVLGLSTFRAHKLKADRAEFWSLWVNGNWRLTFRFMGKDVELLDYEDYH